MVQRALVSAESLALIAAVSVPLHVLGGLDWPFAALVGAAASIVLRWLIHGPVARRRATAGRRWPSRT